MVKNPPTNVGASGDSRGIPGLGRSPGEGNGYPLQYSCLENSMDGGYSPWGLKKSNKTNAHKHTSGSRLST